MTDSLGNPCTPEDRRDYLRFYARTLLREAKARGGCAWMVRGALRARREAAEIRLGPAQGVLL